MPAYDEDLAYIHDAGFGHVAEAAAKRLLAELRQRGFDSSLVVDLGCGSGIVSQAVSQAGFQTLGIDISPAMIELAKTRVPKGTFRVASLFSADIPACVAVVAAGECFNYLFDRGNSRSALRRLLRRIFAALSAKGILLFDIATPGRVPPPGVTRNFQEGADWAVLYAAEENRKKQLLTRSITTFRKTNGGYRRNHETHDVRLIPPRQMAADLRSVGFRVRILGGYGEEPFVRGRRAFLAVK